MYVTDVDPRPPPRRFAQTQSADATRPATELICIYLVDVATLYRPPQGFLIKRLQRKKGIQKEDSLHQADKACLNVNNKERIIRNRFNDTGCEVLEEKNKKGKRWSREQGRTICEIRTTIHGIRRKRCTRQ